MRRACYRKDFAASAAAAYPLTKLRKR